MTHRVRCHGAPGVALGDHRGSEARVATERRRTAHSSAMNILFLASARMRLSMMSDLETFERRQESCRSDRGLKDDISGIVILTT